MTGNIALVQDLVQETYLRAWAAHRQLKDWQFFKTWITTILMRENARWFAKGKHNLVDYDDELYSPIIDFPEFELDGKDRLLHLVKALPKLYREPMWLFLQGNKCEDIGGIISPTKVGKQLYLKNAESCGIEPNNSNCANSNTEKYTKREK